MPAEHDDLFGSKPFRGDHTTQTNRAVADDCRNFPRTDLRADCCVMSGTHDIRESEKAGHQFVVGPHRQFYESPIRLRDAHCFALATVEFGAAPESAVQTRGLQSFPTELAGSVRPGEWRDDKITALDGADIFTNRFDDADELVPHPASLVGWLHRLVRPEVAAADAGVRDPEKCVGWFLQSRIGDVLDANVARAVHDSGSQSFIRRGG